MIKKIYGLLKKLFMTEHLRVYWNDSVEDFARFNAVAEHNSIVLLGDSITDYFRIGEFYFDKRIYNRGISGDTSAGVLARIKESVYDLKPEKVFLLIGTNDIARPHYSEEKTANNIADIVRGINENCQDSIVYVESVYPVNSNIKDSSVYGRKNELVESLNTRIQSEIKHLKAEYINVYPLMQDGGGDLKAAYTYDGLHLNGVGYKKVVEILKPYLDI